MASPFKTGRSRALTITGSMAASCYQDNGANEPNRPRTYYQWQATLGQSQITVIQATGTVNSPSGWLSGGHKTLEVQDSQLGTSDTESFDGASLPVPPPLVQHDVTNSVSWSISIEVEEWCNIAVPSDIPPTLLPPLSSTQYPYPVTGGSAHADGVPAIICSFYELTKIGGTKTVTATADGVTASISGTMTSADSVQYGPSYDGWMNLQPFGGGPGVHGPYSASMSWTDSTSPAIPGAHWSDVAGSTVDLTSGTAIALNGTGTGTWMQYAEVVQAWAPPIEYYLNARLKCFTGDYPASMNLNINDWTGHVTTLPIAPTSSHSWSQVTYDAGVNLNGTGYSAINAQQSPVSCYLANPGSLGDDSRDWRCMFRGTKWDAISLSRASSLLIDDCSASTHWTAGSHTSASIVSGHLQLAASGGSGSATLTVPSTVRVWEIFRFLQATALFLIAPYDDGTAYVVGQFCSSGGTDYQCISPTTGNAPPNATYWSVYTAPASINVTLGLAGHTWTVPVTDSATSPQIDLCCADDETDTVQTKQSRFPIKNNGGFPTNTDPTDQYKMGWGVDYCDSLVVSGIPDGFILELHGISLELLGSGGEAAITFLEPFEIWPLGWTEDSDTDKTYVRPSMLLQSDFRVSDWPLWAFVQPTVNTDTTEYYRYYTISEAKTMLAYLPGLTVALLTTPTDGYHNDTLPALLLGGDGAVFDWGTGLWVEWVDNTISGTLNIPAQDLFDEVATYPGCGNPWTQSDLDYGGPTPLEVTKFLRGQANGLVFTTADLPYNSAFVDAYETAHPTVTQGQDNSNSEGAYFTGTPWGFGNINTTTELHIGSMPYLNDSGYLWENRYRKRTSFRKNIGVNLSPICSWNRQEFGWGYTACCDSSNTYIYRNIVNPDTQFIAENFVCTALAGTWLESPNSGQYLFYVESGTDQVNCVKSIGLEAVWGSLITIANGTQVCSDFNKGLNMTMVCIFYASGGMGTPGDWTAWTSVNGGTFINAGTILSSVSESPGALTYEGGPIDQWRFSYVNGSGAVVSYVSKDSGQTWT